MKTNPQKEIQLRACHGLSAIKEKTEGRKEFNSETDWGGGPWNKWKKKEKHLVRELKKTRVIGGGIQSPNKSLQGCGQKRSKP